MKKKQIIKIVLIAGILLLMGGAGFLYRESMNQGGKLAQSTEPESPNDTGVPNELDSEGNPVEGDAIIDTGGGTANDSSDGTSSGTLSDEIPGSIDGGMAGGTGSEAGGTGSPDSSSGSDTNNGSANSGSAVSGGSGDGGSGVNDAAGSAGTPSAGDSNSNGSSSAGTSSPGSSSGGSNTGGQSTNSGGTTGNSGSAENPPSTGGSAGSGGNTAPSPNPEQPAGSKTIAVSQLPENSIEIQDNTVTDTWGVVLKSDWLPNEFKGFKTYSITIEGETYELPVNKYNSSVLSGQVSSLRHTKEEIAKGTITVK